MMFSEPKPPGVSRGVDYCRVTLKSREIATSSARIFEPVGAAVLFAEMAAESGGWEGEKQWSSLDEDFALSCAYDAGSAAVAVTLRGPYHEGEWCVQAVIHVEASRLGEVAAQLKRFMHL